MQQQPQYKNVVKDIIAFFKQQIILAKKSGIKQQNIILDPGIGFGKTLAHNLTILKNISTFKHAFPNNQLLIGASRKSFIGKLTGAEVDQRLPGTLAVDLLAANQGADILRVHDVAEHMQALQLWQLLQ
jgi:dihydropteroate synthase